MLRVSSLALFKEFLCDSVVLLSRQLHDKVANSFELGLILDLIEEQPPDCVASVKELAIQLVVEPKVRIEVKRRRV